ncbi:MAG TPA: SOS response-associated peptidase [Bacteroidales bacterium]|jgi:putative SOS response-associated peptidase YedK|nr:SOS response-associated peptidase [Bacteroidales bacterium]
MCFSVNVNLVKEELESRFGATLIDPERYRPSYYYHAFAIPELPVVCSEDPSRINLFRWGLIPARTRTSKDAENIRSKTFNARCESIEDKPSFSCSFRTKRCIIPVRGFFEWQHAAREKIPWYIYLPDKEIMSLAGLYDHWTSDVTGELINTFTVITTESNTLLSEIHNSTKRMPAILDRESGRIWLDGDTSSEDAMRLLQPLADGILRAHTIGPLVNDKNADRNTPEVIRPFHYYIQNTLF